MEIPLKLIALNAVNAQKVQYGNTATKQAITTVLDAVLPVYKYSSLPELNAVLRQYNVVADRGSEESRIYQKGGLVYRVLNEQGEKVGVPIKASAIYSKPAKLEVQGVLKAVLPVADQMIFPFQLRVDLPFRKSSGQTQEPPAGYLLLQLLAGI